MAYFQLSIKWDLTHNTFHQRGFSLTILSDKSNLLTSFYSEVHVIEHYPMVGLAYLVADNGIVATTQTWWELQVHG